MLRGGRTRALARKPDGRQFLRLLRARCKRPRRRAAEKREDRASSFDLLVRRGEQRRRDSSPSENASRRSRIIVENAPSKSATLAMGTMRS